MPQGGTQIEQQHVWTQKDPGKVASQSGCPCGQHGPSPQKPINARHAQTLP
jgi:hypothetical protein